MIKIMKIWYFLQFLFYFNKKTNILFVRTKMTTFIIKIMNNKIVAIKIVISIMMQRIFQFNSYYINRIIYNIKKLFYQKFQNQQN
jgi:hypothetical protein